MYPPGWYPSARYPRLDHNDHTLSRYLATSVCVGIRCVSGTRAVYLQYFYLSRQEQRRRHCWLAFHIILCSVETLTKSAFTYSLIGH